MKRRKILLVDDVALFIQLEKSFLSRDLFDISTARSGKEALRSVKSSPPDLVLLDLYMPDMNGDAVCRVLKDDPLTAHIPVIIVTSEGEKDFHQIYLASGCDDIIQKPLRPDLLLAAVERQLQVTQRRHQRVSTDLACTVRAERRILDGKVRNLSRGGAFLELGAGPSPDRTLGVSFSMPGFIGTCELKAAVKWKGAPVGNYLPGVGVEFLDPDRVIHAGIGRFVDMVLERNPEYY